MSDDVAVVIGQHLRRLGLTLAAAESCTGGLVGSLITDVAGSSDYFLGSAVTYANSAKAAVLGVDALTLASHGAVSAEVAQEMARRVRFLFGADIGLAVTGIAGPAGGTPDKPVGLTYLHLSAPDAEWGEHHVWQGDRLANKQQSATAVLALLLRYLEHQAGDDTRGTAQPPAAAPGLTGEPVTVELGSAVGMLPHPHAFTWHGQRYQVAAIGRRWQLRDETATWQCLLVQTPAHDTFQLGYRADTGEWRVVRSWLQPRTV